MFHSISATKGYAAELKALKGRTFEFTKNINILFGPNGCGKTSLLRLLAAYSGIDMSQKNTGGGWSRPPKTFFRSDKVEFPASFECCTPSKSAADVVWDGQPVFYNSASLSEGGVGLGYFVDSAENSPDGMMDMMEQVGLITGHYSEGELRQHKLGKVVQQLKNPPKAFTKPGDHAGDAEKQYAAYIRSLSREGPLTVLWDEPDRSLSVENQIRFWINFLPQIGEAVQVIIATHSYIPMLMPQFGFVNIIDVQEGYLQKSRTQLYSMIRIGLEVTKDMKEEPPKPPEPPKVFTLDTIELSKNYECVVGKRIAPVRVDDKLPTGLVGRNLNSKRELFIKAADVPKRIKSQITNLDDWRLHNGD